MNNQEVSTAYVGSTEIKECRLGSQLVLAPNGDALWYKANEIPTLDLRFAENESLVDATTGQNLVTFTRASGGIYTDSQGVIRNAVTNLLLRSEEFDQSPWGTSNSAVTPNQAVAPNGTTTADLLVKSAAFGSVYQLTNISNLTTHTASFYVKKETNQNVTILITDNGVSNTLVRAYINLDTGVVTNVSGITTAIPVGNGWYRVYTSFTYTNALNHVYLYPGISSDTSTGGIYLWGAQLEQSSTVGEYVPTTSTINSAPRFDHNPTTGESLGLLVEESRSNLLWPSQFTSFGTTAANNIWYETVADLDCTSNNATAPDGTTTAALLAVNANTSFRAVFNRTGSTATGTLAFSVYCKPASTDLVVRLFIAGEAALTNNAWANFTLSGTGTASAATVTGTATAPIAPSITPAGNGWYRCVLYASFTGPANITCLIYPGTATAQTTASQTLVWGAQLEAGAFPTSYIPTTTAAATRAADVASITGANFSSFYRQDEGTMFAQSFAYSSANSSIVGFDDGTNNERWRLVHTGAGVTGGMVVIDGGVTQMASTNASNSWPLNSAGRIAGALKADDCALSTNSSPVVEDASVTIPTVNQMTIGISQAHFCINSTIRRLTYWPARLSNNVLQELTR